MRAAARSVRFIWELALRCIEDGVARASAQFAYHLAFSLFPILLFINAALGMLELGVEDVVVVIAPVLPPEVLDLISDYFEYLGRLGVSGAKLLFVAGLSMTFFSLATLMRSYMHTSIRAYRLKPPGSVSFFLLSLWLSFFTLLSLFVLLVTTLVSETLLLKLSAYVPVFSAHFIALWGNVRYVIAAAYMVFMLCSYYRVILTKKEAHVAVVLPGAVFSVAVWIISSMIFTRLVSDVGRYALVYGSIGTVMIFLLWLYLTGMVLGIGVELNGLIYTKRKSQGGRHEQENSGIAGGPAAQGPGEA